MLLVPSLDFCIELLPAYDVFPFWCLCCGATKVAKEMLGSVVPNLQYTPFFFAFY
jgi:hypothetical protein